MKSAKKRTTRAKKERKLKILRIGLVILVLIIAFRIILPYWVLGFVNKRLAHINGYYGHVEDIDIELYHGAYEVNNIYINRVDTATNKQTPFFAAPIVDISIEWRSLF